MTRVHYRSNQSSLHQALKEAYGSLPGRDTEVVVEVGGNTYRLDVHDSMENTAYEIQLGNYGKEFYPKIAALITKMNTVIIHPVITKRKIIRMKDGEIVSTGYSVDKAGYYSFFENIVGFRHPFIPGKMRFDLLSVRELVLKQQVTAVRKRDRYKTVDRELLGIEGKKTIAAKEDFLQMIPKELSRDFTNRDLAEALDLPVNQERKYRLAGCMTYSLCSLGILIRKGKRGRAYVFREKS